ncbi:MAG: hypothetical protein F6K58_27090 [Symploca sp. SIO2E9]|nr:hypothetical protein [Symploca sp. SIO2E9]
MPIPSSSLSYSPSAIGDSQSVKNCSRSQMDKPYPMELIKFPYQADQQVKYLYLQAEVESLLQHLQIIKQQRLTWVQPDSPN